MCAACTHAAPPAPLSLQPHTSVCLPAHTCVCVSVCASCQLCHVCELNEPHGAHSAGLCAPCSVPGRPAQRPTPNPRIVDSHPLPQVVGRSTELDGDAVVVLFRAMCAVSREELEQSRPRTYFLHRLVEAAHANMGEGRTQPQHAHTQRLPRLPSPLQPQHSPDSSSHPLAPTRPTATLPPLQAASASYGRGCGRWRARTWWRPAAMRPTRWRTTLWGR